MSMLKAAIFNQHIKSKNSKMFSDLVDKEDKILSKIRAKQDGLKKFDKKVKKHLNYHKVDFLEKIRDREIKELEELIKELHKIQSLLKMYKDKINVDDITETLSHLKIAFGSKRKRTIPKRSKRKMSKKRKVY